MITIKSDREIEIMKEAGHITELAHQAVAAAIRPGISTAELDKIAYDTIIEHGATPSFLNYEGYPASICASINEMIIHGIPKKHIILKKGDIISIDIGAYYKGYHGDCARTHLVGEVDPEVKKLVEVTEQSFYEGMKFAKPGNHLSDISHGIEQYVNQFGYGIVREYTGHGVGRHMHEDPSVPNYGEAGHGVILKKGMVIAVEPMITLGSRHIKMLKDGWGVVTKDGKPASHYENTIVITDNGYEILTK